MGANRTDQLLSCRVQNKTSVMESKESDLSEPVDGDIDGSPPALHEDVLSDSEDGKTPEVHPAAPVLSVVVAPKMDCDNALRSPPKLLPAVVMNKRRKSDETKTLFKPLSGSMKNTSASLSIIEAPSANPTKSTRSTRSSIDPTFAAKQRSFLNKVHNALSSAPQDDTSCESDQEAAPEEDYASDDKSPEYVPGCEVIPRRVSSLLNGGSKRRRDDSPVRKLKLATIGSTENLANSNVLEEKSLSELSPPKKRLIVSENGAEGLSDIYCWLCHREDPTLGCATCPRAYHHHCLRRPTVSHPESEWVCMECVNIIKAENQETRSKALKLLKLDKLCKLLLFAVERMRYISGAEVFEGPVDTDQFPTYLEHIINPMHLSLLEKNIKKKMYGSTEAFVADASWIVHNCIIFNSFNSKLTSVSKNILRVCKQEMAEIENCPDCYNYAYTSDENWFIQVCQKPHVLVWAKLKGFPYWPAKAMRHQSDTIDVRFFGAHDRAWVPSRDCYLYSHENPNPNAPNKIPPTQPQPRKRNPRNNLDTCIEEVEAHIKLLKERFSVFQYAPLRSAVNHKNLDGHLKAMLPEYNLLESNAATPTKVPLQKRASFELKNGSSGPSVKRMKADSSSPHHSNVMPSPAEEGNITPKVECETEEVLKIRRRLSACLKENSKDNAENDNPTHSSDNVTKENGKKAEEVEEVEKANVTVTCHTVTPGQSQIFTTPLDSPEVNSIAELRLKKKDARRGLIDRLQEKLALWTSRPQSEESCPGSSEMEQEGKDNENIENDGDRENSSDNGAELQCTVDKSETTDHTKLKRDLFAGAKIVSKESVSQILQNYNMNKNQPKVVLQKLIVGPDKSLILRDQTVNQASKIVCAPANGQEGENALNVKKIRVAEMELLPEDEEEMAADEADQQSGLESKPIQNNLAPEAADSVTSTTSSLHNTLSPIKSVFIKDVQSGLTSQKPKPDSMESEVKSSLDKATVKQSVGPIGIPPIKPTNSSINITKFSSTELESKSSSEPLSNSTISKCAGDIPIVKKAALAVAVESTVKTKAEPVSDVEEELESEDNENEVQEKCTMEVSINGKNASNIVENTVKNSDPVKTVESGLSKGSKLPQPELKVIAKSFTIRARPISDLKDIKTATPLQAKQSKLLSNQKTSSESEKPLIPTSSSLGREIGSNSDNAENLVALKSLLAKNVTVQLETPKRKVKKAVKEEETLVIIPCSSENSSAPSSVNTKSTNNIKLVESPPKTSVSPRMILSPTQRLLQGTTSILKVNKGLSSGEIKTSVSSDSPEETVRPSPPRVLIAGNITVSKPQSSAVSSALMSSAVKSPTFVTVSQAGVPIRILPKAIPLTPALAGATIQITSKSGTMSTVTTASATVDTLQVTNPRPGLRSLLTTVSPSAFESGGRVAVSQGRRVQSEVEGVVKIPTPRITVGPLLSGPSSVPEITPKPVAIAPKPPSVAPARIVDTSVTTLANSKRDANVSTQVNVSSESCASKFVPRLSVGKGPASGELKSQANKMADVFLGCLEDCLSGLSSNGNLEARVRVLQLEMERMQWQHQQEIDELRHNTELVISEIQERMKMESQHALNKAFITAKQEKEKAISATKERQWCASCKKEALFYCCWNTSYCDYRCQQNHWPVHSLTCTQNTASVDTESHQSAVNEHTKH